MAITTIISNIIRILSVVLHREIIWPQKKKVLENEKSGQNIQKKLLVDNVSSNEQIKEQFEEYYASNNKSLAELADLYTKNILLWKQLEQMHKVIM